MATTALPPQDHLFAALLRHFRLLHGLTQEQLADASQLSLAAIRRLENGSRRCPRAYTVSNIACALALSDHERALLMIAAHPHVIPLLPLLPKEVLRAITHVCPDLVYPMAPANVAV